MHRNVFRFISSILVAAVLSMSVQQAQARMYEVDHTDGAANAAERAALIGFVERAEVARELERRGVDPSLARERIEAMTDSEVHALSGTIESSPAGGFMTGAESALALLGILAIVGIIVAIIRNAFASPGKAAAQQ